jgi:hypothetical protein
MAVNDILPPRPNSARRADRFRPPPLGVRGEHPWADKRPVDAGLLDGKLDCAVTAGDRC